MHLSARVLNWTHVARLIVPGQRKILGLVAPPGAGNHAGRGLAGGHYPGDVQMVPMDGFHLANVPAGRVSGRSQRKGASDTFDAAGFADLIATHQKPVYAVAKLPFTHPTSGATWSGRRRRHRRGRRRHTADHHRRQLTCDWTTRPGPRCGSVVDEVWYLEVPDEACARSACWRATCASVRSPGASPGMDGNRSDEPNARRIAQTAPSRRPCVMLG